MENNSVKTQKVVKNDWIIASLNQVGMPTAVAVLGVVSWKTLFNRDFDMLYI